jgi:PleD family two-component response regulator
MKIKNNENKKKILIVDDDPDICVTLREIFKQNGFIADSFTDPLFALDNLKLIYMIYYCWISKCPK